MSKQPTDLTGISQLYAQFMEEIKLRTAVIESIFNRSCQLAPMPGFEFCYLQLRKICELFALSCLAAHGDIAAVRTKSLQKEWNADEIIKQLGELHPEFYPRPSRQQLNSAGRPVRFEPVEDHFLTKDELLKLYGECGNYLHRGSVRQLLGQWEPEPDFQKINEWVGKIVQLLNHHQIQTSDPDTQLWVLMNDKDDGKVKCAVMRRMSTSQIPPTTPSPPEKQR